MAYNGAGTFAINSAGQPVVAGTTITSTAFNALTADLGVGLSTAICKDGQTTTTASVPFTAGAGFGAGNASSFDSSGNLSAVKVNVTGTGVPTNGVYLPAANCPAISVNGAEAARFNSMGLLVGSTSAIASMDTSGGQVGASRGFFTGGGQGLVWGASTYINGTSGVAINAFVGSGGASLLSGATAWSATSDETSKTPFAPFTDALNKVASLKSGTGRYLTDDEGVSRSFLSAQSVQAVLPEAVGIQDDGKLALRYQEVIPLLVAALAEAKTRVEALEATLGR